VAAIPGSVTERIRFSREGRIGTWLQAIPFLVLWVGFVLVPVVLLFVWSFWHETEFWMRPGFTLDAYRDFFSGVRFQVFIRTIRVAVITVLIILPFAYAFAFVMQRVLPLWERTVIFILLTAPFFTSFEARMFIWRSILGRTGLVNSLLVGSGLTSTPIDVLLFTEGAVIFGLAVGYYPFMIFPILMSLGTIENQLIEASGDLGGSPWQTFREVVLPLSFPGVMAGCIFVFVSILGEAVISQLLGGGSVTLLGLVIPDTLFGFRYPLAAAMSTVLIALSLGAVLLLNRLLRGGRLLSMLSHERGEV
jgi:ABC-type spermidine/putrescine transport system permease subunit I